MFRASALGETGPKVRTFRGGHTPPKIAGLITCRKKFSIVGRLPKVDGKGPP